MIPIDLQIEALETAWERQISRLHLGASPYDDDPDDDMWTDGREAEDTCLESRKP